MEAKGPQRRLRTAHASGAPSSSAAAHERIALDGGVQETRELWRVWCRGGPRAPSLAHGRASDRSGEREDGVSEESEDKEDEEEEKWEGGK